MATIGTLAVNVVARTGALNSGLSRARGSVSRFASAGKSAFSSFGIGALSAAGALGALVRENEGLERTMNRSLAIMSGVSKVMREDMTAAAIQVAKTTTFSATQAAESYFFLASAGLTAAESLKAMPTVAQFAMAGNFDLALATDLLTDAQSALGLTSKDAAKNLENMARVGDVLVKAGTLANATVQQFSESLTNKAGAALRRMNISLEEGAAALAIFADQGVKGSDGGTALSIVLRELSNKAITSGSAWKEAGLAVFDANESFRGIAPIIESLTDKLGDMTDKQKTVTLLNLGFQAKSVGFISSLLGTSEAMQEHNEKLDAAGGIMDTVASKQMTNLEKAFAQFKGKWTDMADGVGVLNQAFVLLVKGGTGVLGFFDFLNKKLNAAADRLGVIVTDLTSEELLRALNERDPKRFNFGRGAITAEERSGFVGLGQYPQPPPPPRAPGTPGSLVGRDLFAERTAENIAAKLAKVTDLRGGPLRAAMDERMFGDMFEDIPSIIEDMSVDMLTGGGSLLESDLLSAAANGLADRMGTWLKSVDLDISSAIRGAKPKKAATGASLGLTEGGTADAFTALRRNLSGSPIAVKQLAEAKKQTVLYRLFLRQLQLGQSPLDQPDLQTAPGVG